MSLNYKYYNANGEQVTEEGGGGVFCFLFTSFCKIQWYIFQHYNILVNLVILMAGFHNFIIAKIAGKKLCDHSNFVKNISSCQRKHA